MQEIALILIIIFYTIIAIKNNNKYKYIKTNTISTRYGVYTKYME